MPSTLPPRALALVLLLFAGVCLKGHAAQPPAKSISMDQLGVEAQKQYTGSGISITPVSQGAHLRAIMQDLEATAGPDGLWVKSVNDQDASKNETFRVRAESVGRDGGADTQLPAKGSVRSTAESAVWLRPDMIEEYRVSADGIRQDFILPNRPSGNGTLRVQLGVSGVQIETASYGTNLKLPATGREIAYSKLQVTDARGRPLAARMQVVSTETLVISVDDSQADYPVRIDPTFSDADWVSMNAATDQQGVDDTVWAFAADANGNLYAGGEFTSICGVTAQKIAKWDGNSWAALGSGINGTVFTITTKGTDVYVGGQFSTAGGLPASCVAKWNGSTWSALGSGTNQIVRALLVMGDDLYAGGLFLYAGGNVVHSIAKWDGSSWSALGTGIGPDNVQGVFSLASINGELYMAGSFDTAGGVTVNNIAKWNGSIWSALGSGVNSLVEEIAVIDNNLYAAGYFTTAGGNPANRIAQWNGTEWSALGAGLEGGTPYSLAVQGQNLYAGGTFKTAGGAPANRVARWDGNAWSPLSSGVGSSSSSYRVNKLFAIGGKLYAGGDFYSAGDVGALNLAEWNGNSWTPFRIGMDGSVFALALYNNELYMAGSFTFKDKVTLNGVAKWNGSGWSPVDTGMNGRVNALLVSGGELYAAGSFTQAGSVAASNIAKFNGSQWSSLGSGLDGTVNALAALNGQVYAGGSFTKAGELVVNRMAVWNGSEWSALGSGVDNTVYCLTTVGSHLYAGGQFSTAGGQTASRMASWNGTAWSPLGSGTTFTVRALATNGSDLYAGGSSSQGGTGGGAPGNVVKWDGSVWSAMGPLQIPSVTALHATDDDGPYAATVNGDLWKWNNGTWLRFGAAYGDVNAFLPHNGGLYLGGSFSYAGYTSSAAPTRSPRIVRLNLHPPEIAVTHYQAGTRSIENGATISMGSLSVGQTSFKHFFIENLGTRSLSGVSVTVDGAHSSDFTVATQPKPMVPWPGEINLTTIVFSPGGHGVRTATLHIASNDADEDPFDIILSGAGIAPEIKIEQSAGTDLTDNVSTVPYGPVYVSTTASLTFTIKNIGSQNLTNVAVTLDGENGTDFTLSSPPANSLAPNGSTTFTVTFSPSALGPRTAGIHISSNDPDEGSFDMVLTGEGSNTNVPITTPPVSLLAVEGAPASLVVTSPPHPSLPLSFQWRKNGKTIPGATSGTLAFAPAKAADAATYVVRVTLGTGYVEHTATLAVAKPVTQLHIVLEGTSLKPTVVISGEATLVWQKGQEPPLGETGKILNLPQLSAATGSGVYTCTAAVAGGNSLVIGSFDIRVFKNKTRVQPEQEMPDGRIGSYYSHQILLLGDTDETPTTYAAKNLPAGLTLNTKTGLISGIPTLAKTFTKVSVSASNSRGGTTSDEEDIVIAPMPSGIEGTFTGGVARQSLLNDNLGGLVDFTVASTGAVSGSLTLGATKHGFKGAVRTDSTPPRAAISIPRTGKATLKLNLDFDPPQNLLALSSNLTDNTSNAAVTGWRQVWKATGTPPLKLATPAPKLFTLALRPPAGAGLPEGDGYGSFTLGRDGKLTLTGKTPDGESFTCGTFAGPQGQILVFQTLHAPKGSLFGTLDIDPEDTSALDADVLEGLVSWLRPANAKSRVSPLGFGPMDLNAFGARYNPPAANGLILGMSPGDKASLAFTGGGLASASINPTVNTLDILAGNKPSFTSDNLGSVKITTLNATTGLFSGTFTLEDTELRAGSFAGKKLKRPATFNGILTQANGQPFGLGHFLLPEMPKDAAPPLPATTPTTSEMRPGRVVFQKQAAD